MNEQTKRQVTDVLLSTHELLEAENVRAALQSDDDLNTAKGVIARLVLIVSNTKTAEVTPDESV